MTKFLADENFNGKILRGALARNPLLDILRWQDIAREGEDDPVVLEWATKQGRILLTHDSETMVGFAYERIKKDLPMFGLVVVNPELSFRVVIEDILLIAEASLEDEYQNQVIYLPL